MVAHCSVSLTVLGALVEVAWVLVLEVVGTGPVASGVLVRIGVCIAEFAAVGDAVFCGEGTFFPTAAVPVATEAAFGIPAGVVMPMKLFVRVGAAATEINNVPPISTSITTTQRKNRPNGFIVR